MAEIDLKSFPGFGIDDTVEDAEFESIVPQSGRPRAMSSFSVSLEPDHLSILKRGSSTASASAWFSGLPYWFFVLAAASGTFWIAGGYMLFR